MKFQPVDSFPSQSVGNEYAIGIRVGEIPGGYIKVRFRAAHYLFIFAIFISRDVSASMWGGNGNVGRLLDAANEGMINITRQNLPHINPQPQPAPAEGPTAPTGPTVVATDPPTPLAPGAAQALPGATPAPGAQGNPVPGTTQGNPSTAGTTPSGGSPAQEAGSVPTGDAAFTGDRQSFSSTAEEPAANGGRSAEVSASVLPANGAPITTPPEVETRHEGSLENRDRSERVSSGYSEKDLPRIDVANEELTQERVSQQPAFLPSAVSSLPNIVDEEVRDGSRSGPSLGGIRLSSISSEALPLESKKTFVRQNLLFSVDRARGISPPELEMGWNGLANSLSTATASASSPANGAGPGDTAGAVLESSASSLSDAIDANFDSSSREEAPFLWRALGKKFSSIPFVRELTKQAPTELVRNLVKAIAVKVGLMTAEEAGTGATIVAQSTKETRARGKAVLAGFPHSKSSESDAMWMLLYALLALVGILIFLLTTLTVFLLKMLRKRKAASTIAPLILAGLLCFSNSAEAGDPSDKKIEETVVSFGLQVMSGVVRNPVPPEGQGTGAGSAIGSLFPRTLLPPATTGTEAPPAALPSREGLASPVTSTQPQAGQLPAGLASIPVVDGGATPPQERGAGPGAPPGQVFQEPVLVVRPVNPGQEAPPSDFKGSQIPGALPPGLVGPDGVASLSTPPDPNEKHNSGNAAAETQEIFSDKGRSTETFPEAISAFAPASLPVAANRESAGIFTSSFFEDGKTPQRILEAVEASKPTIPTSEIKVPSPFRAGAKPQRPELEEGWNGLASSLDNFPAPLTAQAESNVASDVIAVTEDKKPTSNSTSGRPDGDPQKASGVTPWLAGLGMAPTGLMANFLNALKIKAGLLSPEEASAGGTPSTTGGDKEKAARKKHRKRENGWSPLWTPTS